MPQLDYSHYVSQIFWLILCFGLLYTLIARVILPRAEDVIVSRQSDIEHRLDMAEKLHLTAEQLKQEIHNKKLEVQVKVDNMRKQAVISSEKEAKQTLQELNKSLQEQELQAIEKVKAAFASEELLKNQQELAIASTILIKLVGKKINDKDLKTLQIEGKSNA